MTEDGQYTEHLRVLSEPAWTDAVDHRFVEEVAAGTIDDAVFRRYLVQDYAFVDALVGLVGAAVTHAPTIAEKARFTDFLAVLTDEENDYFDRAFDALEVPPTMRTDPDRAEVTAAFEDLVHRAAGEGYPETLAVLVPAEWIYLSWASAVDRMPDRFYLQEWIDLHATSGFEATVAFLRSELDTVGADLPPDRRARVDRHFRRTVDLEVGFFDMAYTA